MSWEDNPQWVAESPAGPLDITINLAKPEKDPRDIAAAAQAAQAEAGLVPQGVATSGGASEGVEAANDGTEPLSCVLCWRQADDGQLACPGAGEGLVRPIELGGEPWAWWFSPYGYFPDHLIVASREHRPMAITHDTIGCLLDFNDVHPEYFIGSNADLPIVGGSLLAHDHFQGGRYRFPLMKAPIECSFEIEGLENVEAVIVRWPASVVRLRTPDRAALAAAACRVLDAWRPFTFEECGIEAFTIAPDGTTTPHNTANPILWREGDNYVMDIVLRNNRTTPERPYGLFHPDESLFHIKKENIGLIEIMGRAILPARLAAELPAIKDECNRAYYEVLKATGVFKQDEAGRHGWDAFIATL